MGREKVMILISSDIEWIKMCDIYTPVNISSKLLLFYFCKKWLGIYIQGVGSDCFRAWSWHALKCQNHKLRWKEKTSTACLSTAFICGKQMLITLVDCRSRNNGLVRSGKGWSELVCSHHYHPPLETVFSSHKVFPDLSIGPFITCVSKVTILVANKSIQESLISFDQLL